MFYTKGSDEYNQLAFKLANKPQISSIKRGANFIQVKSGRNAFAVQLSEENKLYVSPLNEDYLDDFTIIGDLFDDLAVEVKVSEVPVRFNVETLSSAVKSSFNFEEGPNIAWDGSDKIISFVLSGCDVSLRFIDDSHSLRVKVSVEFSGNSLLKNKEIASAVRRYINVVLLGLLPSETFGTDTYIFYRKSNVSRG